MAISKEIKNQALYLRKEKGMSLNEIANELKVSKTTISYWVRDIELNEEQQSVLQKKIKLGHKQACHKSKEQNFEKREEYQNQGKIKAQVNNILHIKGCMLYWAEGSKDRNSVKFSNADVYMHKLFITFLKECYLIKNDEIKIHINCYLNNDLTQKEIEDYWLNSLNLETANKLKTTINKESNNGRGSKKNKLPYGVCQIIVNRTDIVQNIYGAIQEYGDFKNTEWIK